MEVNPNPTVRQTSASLGYDCYGDIDKPFRAALNIYRVKMMSGKYREDIEDGGKVILPFSILDNFLRRELECPWLFKAFCPMSGRETHFGVLEFSSEEGRCYLPMWMIKNLEVVEGQPIRLQCAKLPVATYAKFKPQSVDFMKIEDRKEMLENALRSFSCLTVGDLVGVKHEGKSYELMVLETKPESAVCILDCEVEVDFVAPDGYVDYDSDTDTETITPDDNEESSDIENEVVPCISVSDPIGSDSTLFPGPGYRSDGQESNTSTSNHAKPNSPRGVPDREWKFGKLSFFRPKEDQLDKEKKKAKDKQKKGEKVIEPCSSGMDFSSLSIHDSGSD